MLSEISQQKKYLKKATIQSKFNFSSRDKDILEISKTFTKYYIKYFKIVKKFLPTTRDPRKSSNWKNFEFVQLVIEKYNAIYLEKFIQAQVLWSKEKSKSKVCTPSFLSSEKAIDRYAWFLKFGENYTKDENEDYSEIYLEILKHNALFLYKEKKIKGYNSFSEMFLKKEGLFPNIYTWVTLSKIDNLFLSISRSYHDIYKSLDPDVRDSLPTLNSLSYIRRKIILNQKIKTFCTKVFKDECLF